MSDYYYYARENTCGSCRYYEYEGENTKGYCSWYKAYYYADDSCSHWEEKEGGFSASGGCFLTTACCEYKGLPDDCDELQAMRRIRDEYIRNQPYGDKLIRNYYESAPGIVQKINEREDKAAIYDSIYQQVLDIRDTFDQGRKDEAVIKYMTMVNEVTILVYQEK